MMFDLLGLFFFFCRRRWQSSEFVGYSGEEETPFDSLLTDIWSLQWGKFAAPEEFPQPQEAPFPSFAFPSVWRVMNLFAVWVSGLIPIFIASYQVDRQPEKERRGKRKQRKKEREDGRLDHGRASRDCGSAWSIPSSWFLPPFQKECLSA
jgi:hypothetical protein